LRRLGEERAACQCCLCVLHHRSPAVAGPHLSSRGISHTSSSAFPRAACVIGRAAPDADDHTQRGAARRRADNERSAVACMPRWISRSLGRGERRGVRAMPMSLAVACGRRPSPSAEPRNHRQELTHAQVSAPSGRSSTRTPRSSTHGLIASTVSDRSCLRRPSISARSGRRATHPASVSTGLPQPRQGGPSRPSAAYIAAHCRMARPWVRVPGSPVAIVSSTSSSCETSSIATLKVARLSESPTPRSAAERPSHVEQVAEYAVATTLHRLTPASYPLSSRRTHEGLF